MENSSRYEISSSSPLSNNTISKEEGSLSTMQIISLVIYCIIFVLGVIGNGLVIYVTGFKMKTTVNSVWLLNLALADFFFTLFLIFNIVSLSLNYRWPFGALMCKLNTLVQIITMFTSIFLITAMSLERCLATWVVHWTRNNSTPKWAWILCLSTWVVSLMCSIPFVEPRTVVKNQCVRNKDPLSMKHLAMFRFVIGFLIPFLVITCCYVAIAVRVSRLKSMKKRKVKPFSLILTIILAFFICWLPLHINDLIMIEQEYAFRYNHEHYNQSLHQRARMISPVVVSLAFFNSCVNPFLYTCMCEDFRHELRLRNNNVKLSAPAVAQLAGAPTPYAGDPGSIPTPWSFLDPTPTDWTMNQWCRL
ncbi:C3a anaphylatoxin chemotactic receptor-like isoform X2 [Alosa pseudoharengus]|uniref:C3a anaphylatoxin chemotactic receptor-like isoform X2 n=1 Tax=Alosa pseudoharengus TaxID=34774 RepID=UPI003F8CEAC0